MERALWRWTEIDEGISTVLSKVFAFSSATFVRHLVSRRRVNSYLLTLAIASRCILSFIKKASNMKFTGTLVALLASTGLVAALPEPLAGGGGGGKGYGHLTSSCWTSSTCKATSYYETKTESKPVTVTKTYTVWKPETKTTWVPSTYTHTKYSRLNIPPLFFR
jgi:hypothetical protein